MKTFGKSALAVVLLVVAIATTTYAQQYPKATGYVNDFANLLTREQGALLNDELAAFEKKTTIEIAVVTVPWLNNQSIEDYTKGLAKEWGVGKRSQNNGVVFLTAPKERKMRIETASGAREILTDNRADQIRDDAILPRFKAGNMPQGIIDGTHAIMRALDVSSSPSAGEEKTTSPQSRSNKQTAYDTEILGYIVGGIVGIALLLFLIVPPIQRSKARKYVLNSKRALVTRFAEAENTIRNMDVKEETRKKFANLKGEFSSIEQLTVMSDGINWVKARGKLDSMNYPLDRIVSDMNREIAFAEKARKDGPELMKKIPGMLEAAEKKLAEGKPSPKAAKYLEEARTQYAQVQQSQHSGMTMIDWVILYVILTSIQSNTANAESAHQYANTDHSNDYSSRSSDSSPSYGFGDSSSGFGGGGGFDSGGGGDSSGSW